MSMSRVYYGAIANPIDAATLDLLPSALLAVTDDGHVAWLEPNVDPSLIQQYLLQHAWVDAPVIELNSEEWLMPGFIDTHTASLLFTHFITFGVIATFSMLLNFPTSAGTSLTLSKQFISKF